MNALFPPYFDAEDVESAVWGRFGIEFKGCNQADFKWFPETKTGFSAGGMQMTRLVFNAGLACEV